MNITRNKISLCKMSIFDCQPSSCSHIQNSCEIHLLVIALCSWACGYSLCVCANNSWRTVGRLKSCPDRIRGKSVVLLSLLLCWNSPPDRRSRLLSAPDHRENCWPAAPLAYKFICDNDGQLSANTPCRLFHLPCALLHFRFSPTRVLSDHASGRCVVAVFGPFAQPTPFESI